MSSTSWNLIANTRLRLSYHLSLILSALRDKWKEKHILRMLFEKVIKLNLYSEARRMLIKTQENGEGFWYSQYSSTFH